MKNNRIQIVLILLISILFFIKWVDPNISGLVKKSGVGIDLLILQNNVTGVSREGRITSLRSVILYTLVTKVIAVVSLRHPFLPSLQKHKSKSLMNAFIRLFVISLMRDSKRA